MFRHRSAIHRSLLQQRKTGPKYYRVGRVFLCSSVLPEDGTPVSKYVEVWYVLYTVFYYLYFIAFYWIHLLVDTVNLTILFFSRECWKVWTIRYGAMCEYKPKYVLPSTTESSGACSIYNKKKNKVWFTYDLTNLFPYTTRFDYILITNLMHWLLFVVNFL